VLRGAKAVGPSSLELGTTGSSEAWALAELEIHVGGGGALSWPPCPSAAAVGGALVTSTSFRLLRFFFFLILLHLLS